MNEEATFDRAAFAQRLKRLRGNSGQEQWAKRFGLSYSVVLDIEQERVDPSQAEILVINAIELSPGFMHDVVRQAKADLAALEGRAPAVSK